MQIRANWTNRGRGSYELMEWGVIGVIGTHRVGVMGNQDLQTDAESVVCDHTVL